jgi:hypothetical protein
MSRSFPIYAATTSKSKSNITPPELHVGRVIGSVTPSRGARVVPPKPAQLEIRHEKSTLAKRHAYHKAKVEAEYRPKFNYKVTSDNDKWRVHDDDRKVTYEGVVDVPHERSQYVLLRVQVWQEQEQERALGMCALSVRNCVCVCACVFTSHPLFSHHFLPPLPFSPIPVYVLMFLLFV